VLKSAPRNTNCTQGMGPRMGMYARAHSNRCSQCDRFLYPGDGPSYYFRKNAHKGFPSIFRSGLRCDYTHAIHKTVRRALAGTVRRAHARSLRRAQAEYERRAQAEYERRAQMRLRRAQAGFIRRVPTGFERRA
jgi:hypothetical protein